jgi:uncharacterized RDD family membrane protein YckC
MKCEKCGIELKGSMIVCRVCRHNNAMQRVNAWRAKRETTVQNESSGAAGNSHSTQTPDPDTNLLQFPVLSESKQPQDSMAGSETDSADPPWRVKLKERVREAREKRLNDRTDSGDSNQINPIVAAALNRIQRRTTTRGALAAALVKEDEPDRTIKPAPAARPVKPPTLSTHPTKAAAPKIAEHEAKPETRPWTSRNVADLKGKLEPKNQASPAREQANLEPKSQAAPREQANLEPKSQASPAREQVKLEPKSQAAPREQVKLEPKSQASPAQAKLEPKSQAAPARERTGISTQQPRFSERDQRNPYTRPSIRSKKHIKTQIIEIPPYRPGDESDSSLESPTLWVRSLAGACDLELIATAYLPIFAAYASLQTTIGPEATIILVILLAAITFLYQSVSLFIADRTCGMAVLRMRLVRTDNVERPISRVQKFIRALAATIAFICPPLNLLVMHMNDRRLTLPDIISGTIPTED